MFVAKAFVRKKFATIAEKTDTILDDLIVEIAKKTNRFFIIILSLYVATHFADVSQILKLRIHQALTVVTGIQLFLWLDGIISIFINDRLSERINGKLYESPMATVTLVVARIAIISLILIAILDNLGVNVSTLVTGFGIGGVAVALSVQKILGDLFSSMSIALDKPFKIGEFIVVDEFMGSIERVGLKTTRIRSLSGELLIFPNSALLESRIRNYSKMLERRVVLRLGVIYDTKAEVLLEACEKIKTLINNAQGVRLERGHFADFSASSLDLEFVYWIESGDYSEYMTRKQDLHIEIKKYFDNAGIEFAFPTQTIHAFTENKKT
jgi:small-conductance mechanosensitive channel